MARSRDRCAAARAAGGLRDRRDRPGRRDPACTFHPLRDRAVTAVTGVIAVIAVIAGIVSSGPVWAARTVAKGAVSPVTAVSAGRPSQAGPFQRLRAGPLF